MQISDLLYFVIVGLIYLFQKNSGRLSRRSTATPSWQLRSEESGRCNPGRGRDGLMNNYNRWLLNECQINSFNILYVLKFNIQLYNCHIAMLCAEHATLQVVWNGCCRICLSTVGQHLTCELWICSGGLVRHFDTCAEVSSSVAARPVWVQGCAGLEVRRPDSPVRCASQSLSCRRCWPDGWVAGVQGLELVWQASPVQWARGGFWCGLAGWAWSPSPVCFCGGECACQRHDSPVCSSVIDIPHPQIQHRQSARMRCSSPSPVHHRKDRC